jgi:hypothetical protein
MCDGNRGNDFGDVVRRVLATKLPKLTKQPADKRVLILERLHMNLVPKQILDEIKKQVPSFPQLADVDEVWILETIGYEPFAARVKENGAVSGRYKNMSIMEHPESEMLVQQVTHRLTSDSGRACMAYRCRESSQVQRHPNVHTS